MPTDIASLVAERQKIKAHLEAQQAQFAEYCKPYNEQIVRLGIIGINTKKVEEDISTNGIDRIYTYPAKDIFLDKRPPAPDSAPRWDDDFPDNFLKDL